MNALTVTPPPVSSEQPSMLRVRVIPAREITPAEQAAWSAIQREEASLASPFFRPEFTAAVAAARNDVFVGIFERGDEMVGFFPHQVGRGRVGRPVGGPLSDYQGVIVRGGAAWEAKQLMCSCGLAEWRFDHLLASQAPFERFHRNVSGSPVIDLGGQKPLLANGSEPRKKRNLEREVGPLRFEFHSTNPTMLQTLMRWKSQQYLESGKIDIFTIPWVVSVVERVHAAQGEDFAGVLSVLYAGDRPAAAHMGMRSRTDWHYWLPAYDPELGKYSPGMLLLLEMAERGPAAGMQVIDLGKGKALYKERLMSRSISVAEGAIAVSLGRSALRNFRDFAATWLRAGPLAVPAKNLARVIRDTEGRWRFVHRLKNRWRFH